MEILKLIIFCDGIELMVTKLGIQKSRYRNRVGIGIIERNAEISCRASYKLSVKVSVMSNQHNVTTTDKLKKFRQYDVYRRRIRHVLVGDRRKLGYVFGDLAKRIYKHIEFIDDLGVMHLYGADLDYLTFVNR